MAPFAALSVTLFSFLYLAQDVLGQTCYYPDGSSDSSHIACSSGGTSVCCAEGFECLSNGLCSDPRYKNYERILRGGCTDKNWGSGCLQTCTTLWPKGDESVHLCSSGKYCCGRSDDCCNEDGEFFDFGSPQVIAIAGQTKAQPASTPEEQQDDPQPTTKAQQQDTKSSAKEKQQQQQQQQTQASSQPTKALEQSEPQETQGSQDPQDSPGQKTKASPTGQSNDPDATNSPADPSKTNGSGDDTATVDTAQGSPSGATRIISGSASPSDSANTANTANTASPENPVTTNVINNITNNTIAPPSSPNNTVAIAVGVGVGVGVLIFLLALAACWYVKRKRRGPSLRSQNIFEIGESGGPVVELAGEKRRASRNPFGRGSGMVYEMDGGTKGVELSATRPANEVHGDSADKKWPSMFK